MIPYVSRPLQEIGSSSDLRDQMFENQSKTIIGLERLMLEAAGFDFRNRQPQQLVVKLAQACGFPRSACVTAYNICMDLYSTFAPLKQTTWAMTIACVELTARLYPDETDLQSTLQDGGIDYDKWRVERAEVMGKISLTMNMPSTYARVHD